MTDNLLRRARMVKDAIGDEPVSVQTPYGEVHIERAEVVADGPRSYVDVFLAGSNSGETNYRIVNPPTLIPGGKLDPLTAIACVIGSLGGAQSPKGRRRA
jgi:hypothetical protein